MPYAAKHHVHTVYDNYHSTPLLLPAWLLHNRVQAGRIELSASAMPYQVGNALLEVRPSGNFILRATVMEAAGGSHGGVASPCPYIDACPSLVGLPVFSPSPLAATFTPPSVLLASQQAVLLAFPVWFHVQYSSLQYSTHSSSTCIHTLSLLAEPCHGMP